MRRYTVLLIALSILACNGTQPVNEDPTPSLEHIGQSSSVSYVFYVANNGDLYYVDTDMDSLDLLKYSADTGSTVMIAKAFADADGGLNEGFGMIAPASDGNTVYCMTTSAADAEIWRLECDSDSFEYVTGICGTNWWKVFNLTLSEDETELYFISNNNGPSEKRIYKIDLLASPPTCESVLDISSVVGLRDLCFGGVGVWDAGNNFYAPVWSFNVDDNDLALLQVHVENDVFTARLIHFTDDGTASGNPLFPGFRHHSCWSGIGASENGSIYVAASNHYQPAVDTDIHGNVAIFKYNPVIDSMTLLGDLESVSTAVNNWMAGESQHKVHTFLMEDGDGKIYFASDDYSPSYFVRGSHIYVIDTKTDTVSDYSKTQPIVMLRDFTVVPNGTEPSSTSGVFIEYYGIKGLGLNKNVPGVLYTMLYAEPEKIGHIIRYSAN